MRTRLHRKLLWLSACLFTLPLTSIIVETACPPKSAYAGGGDPEDAQNLDRVIEQIRSGIERGALPDVVRRLKRMDDAGPIESGRGAEIRCLLGRALLGIGQVQAARHELESAASFCDQSGNLGNPRVAIECFLWHGWTCDFLDDFKPAGESFAKALKLVAFHLDAHDRLAIAFRSSLSIHYAHVGLNEMAQVAGSQAFADVLRGHLAQDDLLVGSVGVNYAEVLRTIGRPTSALNLLEALTSKTGENLRLRPACGMRLLLEEFLCRSELGDVATAYAGLKEGMEAIDESGRSLPEFGSILGALGHFELERMRLSVAQDHLRQADAILSQACGSVTLRHADILRDLARSDAMRGDWERAVSEYQRALDTVVASKVGEQGSRVLGMLREAGVVERDREALDASDRRFERGLSLARSVLGKADFFSGVFLLELARNRLARGRVDRAELGYRGALEVLSKPKYYYSEEHLASLHELAVLLAKSGRESEAVDLEVDAFVVIGTLHGFGSKEMSAFRLKVRESLSDESMAVFGAACGKLFDR